MYNVNVAYTDPNVGLMIVSNNQAHPNLYKHGPNKLSERY